MTDEGDDGQSYRFAMASAIDTSRTVNTPSVVTTKNQSLIFAYSMTETTTRRIGRGHEDEQSGVQQARSRRPDRR